MAYEPRIVDTELKTLLTAVGAVLIEGARACGKTETARQVAGSEVLLDVDTNAREAASLAPDVMLAGPVPRLIDEWQVVPSIWNHIRRAVDNRKAAGQFILTGSSVPADNVTRHTGAGRIARLRMRPMSLFETGDSSGAASVGALLAGAPAGYPDPGLTVQALAECVARGGWPGIRSRPLPQALEVVRNYVGELSRADISRVDGRRRDPSRVRRLMASLARNVATSAATASLARDIGGADGAVRNDTIREYLDALDSLMVIEDQPAWAPHLRSRSILRSAPKRHFVDPSLAVAALRATPQRLLREIRWLGQLFESLVIRDLRVYAQAHDAVIRHYRDNTGLEVDAIVESASGPWAAFEIKLGHAQVDEAADHLLTFADRIDTAVSGRPATMGVIVGTGIGYVRPDGIAVIPIGALGP